MVTFYPSDSFKKFQSSLGESAISDRSSPKNVKSNVVIASFGLTQGMVGEWEITLTTDAGDGYAYFGVAQDGWFGKSCFADAAFCPIFGKLDSQSDVATRSRNAGSAEKSSCRILLDMESQTITYSTSSGLCCR